MSKYQPKPRTLLIEPVLRAPALGPGQPGRAEGEAIVAEFREQDLRRAYERDLTRIIKLLSSLRRHDVGLWEEQLLAKARAEQRRRKEGGLRHA